MQLRDLSPRDKVVFTEVVQQAPVGYLGLINGQGDPRVIPLSFAGWNNAIFFHGALHGEKFEILSQQPRVSLNAVLPYSIIPSYWRDAEKACKITQFFQSILVYGSCSIIDNSSEKISALNVLMEKYQPEGGYAPMTTEDILYTEVLDQTGIFRITIDSVSVKEKFGQHWSEDIRQMIIEQLQQRNNPQDQQTLLQMNHLYKATGDRSPDLD